jgi:hypothetical protein
MTATIKSGQFSIACPHSLHETFAYPSFAAYLDANVNGRCDNADEGFLKQYYGWNGDTVESIPLESWTPVTDRANLVAPLGAPSGADVCSSFN